MSVLPLALERLTEVVREAVPDDVTVFDGISTEDVSTNAVIGIGLVADEPDSGIEGTRDIAGLNSTAETYDIGCSVDVVTGDDNLPLVRQQVFALFELVKDAIAVDRSLGGAVMQARITDVFYRPELTDFGPQATIAFTVRIRKL